MKCRFYKSVKVTRNGTIDRSQSHMFPIAVLFLSCIVCVIKRDFFSPKNRDCLITVIGSHSTPRALIITDSSTVDMPYEVAQPHPVRLSPRPPRIFKQKNSAPQLSPLLVSPASSHHSETPPSPADYVLHHYTPDPFPALNATLPLYITLY